ncbi:E3 ubiquitin-protein ligase EL5-like [Panicum miliaceum]|uniref:E3 ubiquitin-protein ligase EL5-like n=1 Tax=Panicum miliaceum TaxID=4540 RepID=A0A3L6TTT1_PANMI|nr:E3 ubiquitin-protein ligase EL5-like [Panicum miliaceum]
MTVTGTSVAAAATMLAAAAAIFITFVLCFYLFLCAKRYRGAAPTIGGGGGAGGGAGAGRGRARFVFAGAGCHGGGGGMDEAAIAALPRREVAAGDPPADCAVCIAEVAAGEAARVLPRCGHAFHVECVDMWLRSHSTCPLCRCAVVDEEAPAPPRAPEADPESPNFPTNVLFVGSQDAVSTHGAAATPAEPPQAVPAQAPQLIPGPIAGVAAVVEAARFTDAFRCHATPTKVGDPNYSSTSLFLFYHGLKVKLFQPSPMPGRENWKMPVLGPGISLSSGRTVFPHATALRHGKARS